MGKTNKDGLFAYYLVVALGLAILTVPLIFFSYLFFSIFLGGWFLAASFFLDCKERKKALSILTDSLGEFTTVLLLPYIFYAGTLGFFRKLLRLR